MCLALSLCPINLSQFPRIPYAGSLVDKRAVTIRPGAVQVCGRTRTSFLEPRILEAQFPRRTLLGSSLNKLDSPMNRGKPPSLGASARYFHALGVNGAFASCACLPTPGIVKV